MKMKMKSETWHRLVGTSWGKRLVVRLARLFSRDDARPRTSVTAQAKSAASFAVVSLMILSAALPAASRASSGEVFAPASAPGEPQQLVGPVDVSDDPVARDGYTVTSRSKLLRQQYSLTYTTTWSGPIRWPFPVAVRISDGFGPRAAPCGGCSTYHTAVDFDPGAGHGVSGLLPGGAGVDAGFG